MFKKKIYKKKSKLAKFKYFIFIIFLLFFCLILFLFFQNYKNIFFEIPEFQGSFFVIPLDRGGKKIENQDKKGLHLTYKENNHIEIGKDLTLKYSIQIFVSENYPDITDKMEYMINLQDNFFNNENLYIVMFNSNIGTQYFLLYNNFYSRELALEYCKKFTYYFDNCIVVNVENLD